MKTAFIRYLLWLTTLISGTWRQMKESDVRILAGSLAFATVISLVPLLAVSLSVFHAYGGFESLLRKIEPFIMQNFVEASGAEISRYIRKAIERVHSGTLGLISVVGLFIASTKVFHDMETAVQKVWQIKQKRSLLKRLAVYWSIMFLGPLILAVALGVIGSRDLGLIDVIPKGVISLGFSFFAFLIIYKIVPACPVRWRSALASAILATIGVGLAQAFYSGLTKDILRYNKIYGSLASVPIFLLWILLLWWIFLAGAAFCATLERYRDRSP